MYFIAIRNEGRIQPSERSNKCPHAHTLSLTHTHPEFAPGLLQARVASRERFISYVLSIILSLEESVIHQGLKTSGWVHLTIW